MKTAGQVEPATYRGPDGRAVQRMFAEIAHRYDFLNHLLSVSIDKRWRRVAVAKVRELLPGGAAPGVVDLCSGTGDLALELYKGLGVPVVSSDFCHPMLIRSQAKIEADRSAPSVRTVEADALSLPFPDGAFAAATNAFGLRNLEDPQTGLSEMLRILRPAGAVVILEFSKPVNSLLRPIFGFYFRRILPRLGAWISGQRFAYSYLPDSVRKFPSQDELAAMMRKAGFADVGYRNLSGGIAALHWGRRPY